jgi:hypothetical protein
MARTSLHGSRPQCSSRMSRLRWPKRRIFRLVDLAANESDHVGWTRDPGKSRIEYQLRHTCCSLNFSLQNVGLQRVQETLLQQLGWHPIRNSTRGLDEHLISDTVGLPEGPCNIMFVIGKCIRLEGLDVANYFNLLPEFHQDLSGWIRAGKLVWKESVEQGIENANPGATSFGFWTRGQSAMEPAARFSELNPY